MDRVLHKTEHVLYLVVFACWVLDQLRFWFLGCWLLFLLFFQQIEFLEHDVLLFLSFKRQFLKPSHLLPHHSLPLPVFFFSPPPHLEDGGLQSIPHLLPLLNKSLAALVIPHLFFERLTNIDCGIG